VTNPLAFAIGITYIGVLLLAILKPDLVKRLLDGDMGKPQGRERGRR
jgi:hypothetical protein